MRHDSQYPLRQAHYVSHSTDFANRAFFFSHSFSVSNEKLVILPPGPLRVTLRVHGAGHLPGVRNGRWRLVTTSRLLSFARRPERSLPYFYAPAR